LSIFSPKLDPVYQQYGHGERDFVVLGVNLQEDAAQVQQYANGLGVTFPVLVDRSGSVTNRQYQVTAMPASLIVDQQGLIFYRHLGPMSGETLTAKLKELGL
jgi:cytochrome c biogenesis protein CcmG/thiol:disulfide interchange protein DsbE